MSTHTLNMTPELLEYLRKVGVREPEQLARMRAKNAGHQWARMQISPEQGALLGLLVGLCGARRALEIGVFTGYSSLCIAGALPADGLLVACDVNEEWTAEAREAWEEAGLTDRIQLHLRPALETLAELRESSAEPFDFAFIDADKGNYRAYYDACLELLRPGGLIAVDNVLWSGKVADPTDQSPDTVAIRELNRHVHEDERVAQSLVPIGDGLMLARKL